MTASQFDKLSDDEIDALPVLPLVIARCAPNTKVRMIDALHRRKAFAAMTGDGVNDSPSLKRADVGIAMGQSGSDVAKDASDIVLTDDNFASILNAIEEGRRMFDNIKKFILHLLAQNVAQAITLLVGLVFKDADEFSVFPITPGKLFLPTGKLKIKKLIQYNSRDYVDHHDHIFLPRHGSRLRARLSRHPPTPSTQPQTWCLYHRSHG